MQVGRCLNCVGDLNVSQRGPTELGQLHLIGPKGQGVLLAGRQMFELCRRFYSVTARSNILLSVISVWKKIWSIILVIFSVNLFIREQIYECEKV